MRNMNELRKALGGAINDVRNGTITAEQARAVEGLGQTIINSMQVEVEYCRMAKVRGSGFIPAHPSTDAGTPPRVSKKTPVKANENAATDAAHKPHAAKQPEDKAPRKTEHMQVVTPKMPNGVKRTVEKAAPGVTITRQVAR